MEDRVTEHYIGISLLLFLVFFPFLIGVLVHVLSWLAGILEKR